MCTLTFEVGLFVRSSWAFTVSPPLIAASIWVLLLPLEHVPVRVTSCILMRLPNLNLVAQRNRNFGPQVDLSGCASWSAESGQGKNIKACGNLMFQRGTLVEVSLLWLGKLCGEGNGKTVHWLLRRPRGGVAMNGLLARPDSESELKATANVKPGHTLSTPLAITIKD